MTRPGEADGDAGGQAAAQRRALFSRWHHAVGLGIPCLTGIKPSIKTHRSTTDPDA